MHNACYDRSVSRPIQIREVADDVVEALKAKAEREHLSLAAYALRVLERDASTPTIAEVLARPPRRSKVTQGQIVAAVRTDREAH
jgi:antitoxin FitA